MKLSTAVVCFLLSIGLTLSCSKPKPMPTTMRSVYYWSTTLNMDSVKTAFMRNYDISRMYIRYFDVVADQSGRAVPNATLKFATDVPQGIDIVPTVFVMPECLRQDRSRLASLIVKRVVQMNETNDVYNVKEIQIDCDWTQSTRQLYAEFMQAMMRECHSRHLKLSSTIRLHQLAQTPPPADRGVLMMYNTGDATDIRCHKPILDMHDAAPYLPRLNDYKLKLSTAYPIFTWRILFRGGRFVGFIHNDGEYPILPSDSIALRQPSAADIIEAVNVIGSRRPDANNEIILFDLNNHNINRLKHKDYEKILNM
ncbi:MULTISPECIES: hypothetical protein [Prevotellaceae]|uniref:hypothetical protein n=1 Tax=Leyella stercorea TaxID=363265 RepID=UPI001F37614F|nr:MULTISPECIES: hypothetical protein [Prevotellaceae]MCI7183391.1 hypothetical protein [Prevotella sp.]